MQAHSAGNRFHTLYSYPIQVSSVAGLSDTQAPVSRLDLAKVYDLSHDLEFQWDEIGYCLLQSQPEAISTIEIIKEDYQHSSGRFIAVLKKWRDTNPDCTFQEFINAVKDLPSINQKVTTTLQAKLDQYGPGYFLENSDEPYQAGSGRTLPPTLDLVEILRLSPETVIKLGYQLIGVDEMDLTASQYQHRTGSLLPEMLEKWRETKLNASLDALLEALRKPSVAMNHFARMLDQKYPLTDLHPAAGGAVTSSEVALAHPRQELQEMVDKLQEGNRELKFLLQLSQKNCEQAEQQVQTLLENNRQLQLENTNLKRQLEEEKHNNNKSRKTLGKGSASGKAASQSSSFEVESYLNLKHPKLGEEPTMAVLLKVERNLAPYWESMAINLGCKIHDVKIIQQAHPQDAKRAVRAAFTTWNNRTFLADRTYKTVIKAAYNTFAQEDAGDSQMQQFYDTLIAAIDR